MFRRVLFLIPVIMTGFFLLANNSLADNSLNVVISEIQFDSVAGAGGTEDDWVELYNPTNLSIDLTGWSIQKTNSSGGSFYRKELIGIIPAHGYFLIVRNHASTTSALKDLADILASGSGFSLSENNTVYLVNNNEDIVGGNDSDIIDKVGFGVTNNFEGMPAIQPNAGQSLERKPGGDLGNGEDTNYNTNDFFIQNNPNSQNSNSLTLPPDNNSPIAIAGSDQNVFLGDEVLFDGSDSSDSDGSIADYQWDFGDSVLDSGVSVSHTYNSIGSYDVILTVTDNLGATSSDSLIINVSAVATTTQTINSSEVVINEFVSDPETGQKEWIELYNNTTSTINLSGFTIEDGVGTIATLSGEIISHGFKVIELSSSKLNNSGDTIVLKYNGEIIDSVSYGDWNDGNISDNAPVANKPNSTARKTNGQDSDIDNYDFSITTTPTKNSSNIITAPIVVIPPPPASTGGSTNTILPVINYSYQKSDVLINEFVSDPSDGEVEWVELYNNTSNTVDLSNWVIEDGSAKKTALSGLISSHQFKVIESPKGSLNNAGDLIILKDSYQTVIDQVAYGNWDDGNVFDNALKTDDPNSVARLVDGLDTDIDYNDFRISSSPTKGLPNVINSLINQETVIPEETITETVIDYPKLIITEVYPNPVGSDMSDEFMELYNPTDQVVNLTDWLLDDIDGGSRPHKISDLIIEPHEYLAFFRSDTKLALNNDTDKARLINPAGEVVDEIEYKNIKEGLAYALAEKSQWQFTSLPTPGEVNEINMAIVKSSSATNVNKIVKITGTVLVEPGVLGAQIFYIRDENIQVYSYKKDFPLLVVGDIIEVTGELSESAGERRIKTKTQNDIKIIGRQDEVLPSEIAIADIDELNLGQLVKISGVVIEVKGNNIYIDDGSDEAKIYLKTTAQIDKSLFKEGEQIELVGIVSNSNAGYRILPRYDTDILVLGEVKGEQETKDASAGNNQSKYLIAIIIFMGLIISWLGYRQFKLKKQSI